MDSRPTTQLDGIIGQKFPVLDDGFVRVIDYMGDDASVVQAARVSYGAGTKSINDDRNLIRYLMRHDHGTPLEMCVIKLHYRCPMDVQRQWIRHRMSSFNEYSTRYSEAINAAQTTTSWRGQSQSNKQGSAESIEKFPDDFKLPHHYNYTYAPSPQQYLTDQEGDLQRHAREIYEERLNFGVAREQARKDLPLSTYTEAYWCVNFRSLMNFLSLRMDSHAQQEIRDYATIIGEQIVARWLPLCWEAFNDYDKRRGGALFSRAEMLCLRELATSSPAMLALTMKATKLSKREKAEFLQKLQIPNES